MYLKYKDSTLAKVCLFVIVTRIHISGNSHQTNFPFVSFVSFAQISQWVFPFHCYHNFINPYPIFANNVDPDQMASEEASDQDLHCLSFSSWIWMKTLYDIIWLADSQKWVRLIKLFSRIKGWFSFLWILSWVNVGKLLANWIKSEDFMSSLWVI